MLECGLENTSILANLTQCGDTDILWEYPDQRIVELLTVQSQPLEVFCMKGFLKNFVKVSGKHLYLSFFFVKATVWSPAALWKMKLQ